MTTPTQSPAVPAGWYPDPGDPRRQRWWDGHAWTPHTHPPAPPAVTPSTATERRKSRVWLLAGLGAAAVVVSVIAVVAVVTSSKGRSYPSAWDPRVTDLVSFVEEERGLDYEHPVEIEFVPAEEFAQSMRVDESELDDEDLADVGNSEALLRSFGLIDGSVDLLDSTSDIQSTGTLAYYTPEEEKVYVRGTELTPAVESTLVHELVHVLQDQHFDLREMEAQSPDPGAVRSLVEGDANRIRTAYLQQLPAAEQSGVTEDEQVDGAEADLATMPDTLVAMTAAPYALGEPAVGVLAARGGNSEVNQAFFKPPSADVQILDPRRLSEDAPEPVDQPELPEGANVLSTDDPMGALFWDIVLARRVGLHPALDVADLWDGDVTVTYETAAGRTCTASAIRATSAEGAQAVLSVLQAWLAAGTQPLDEQTYARQGAAADVVELGVCDPGADSAAPGDDNANQAVALASVRLEFERQALEAGQTMTVARCYADRGIAPLDASDLAADADPTAVQAKVIPALQQAAAVCLAGTR